MGYWDKTREERDFVHEWPVTPTGALTAAGLCNAALAAMLTYEETKERVAKLFKELEE